MLKSNPETGDIYGFLGEGGYVTFENINAITGTAVIVVRGKKSVTKREFLFGQDNVSFYFGPDDMNDLGVGEHPYTLYTSGTNGGKNTIIPDPINNLRPVFKIEE